MTAEWGAGTVRGGRYFELMLTTKETRLGLLLLLLPLTALAVMIFNLPFTLDNDFYYHLKSGELMVHWGHLIRTDVFTYTARGTPEETHSWLSQIIFYLVYNAFGETGMRLLELASLSLAMGMVFRFVWLRTREPVFAAAVAACALLFLRGAITMRPLFLGVGLLYFILLGCFSPNEPLSPRKLSVVFLLTVLWANFHPSALILIPVSLLFSASQLVGFWEDRNKGEGVGLWRSKRLLSILSPVVIIIALMITPNYYRLFLQAYQIQHTGPMMQVNEWRPIALVSAFRPFRSWSHVRRALDFDSISMLVGLFALFLFFVLERKRKLSEILFLGGIGGLFFLLPFTAMRHLPNAFLGFALLAPSLGLALRDAVPFKRLPTAWLGFCIVGLFLNLANTDLYKTQDAKLSVEQAAGILASSGVKGNIFNEFDWGHYLSFRLYPECLIAFDNRASVNEKALAKIISRIRASRGMKVGKLVSAFPETDILVVQDGERFEQVFDPAEWLLIFENDTAIVALKKNSRNQDNLKKIVKYYASEGVPFDPRKGYDSFGVHLARPNWFWKHQEIGVAGSWPTPDVTAGAQGILNSYLEQRNITL